MFPFTPSQLLILIAAAAFGLGVLSTVLGFYKLAAQSYGKEMKVLAAQSARLGQKAVTDNISSLTTSTAQLVDSLNSLVRTSTGIGVFFVVVGVVLMAAAYYVVAYSAW